MSSRASRAVRVERGLWLALLATFVWVGLLAVGLAAPRRTQVPQQGSKPPRVLDQPYRGN